MKKFLIHCTGLVLAGFLSGCATLLPPPPHATLIGKDAQHCDDPTMKTCHFAMIRKLDGAVIQPANRSQLIAEDQDAPIYGTIAMPEGLHTVEIVYRCPNDKTVKAAIFQLNFVKDQSYQVRLKKSKKTCYPYITTPDNKLVKPLSQYLGD